MSLTLSRFLWIAIHIFNTSGATEWAYIADYGNHRILKWSPTASPQVELVAGDGFCGSGLQQLCNPQDLALDASHKIFVTDQSNYRVVRWLPEATQGDLVAGGNGDGASLAHLKQAYGLALDANGNIAIVDAGNSRAVRWLPGGTSGTLVAAGSFGFGTHQLREPVGIAVDANDNIFIADSSNHRIVRWSSGATSGTVAAGGNNRGDALDQLYKPHDIALDSAGNMIIADTYNHRVLKWSLLGQQGEVVAGGNGQGSALNQLQYPKAVAVDAAGNVFVSDTSNHRIVKYLVGATQGEVIAGGNGQGAGLQQLNSPVGIVIIEGLPTTTTTTLTTSTTTTSTTTTATTTTSTTTSGSTTLTTTSSGSTTTTTTTTTANDAILVPVTQPSQASSSDSDSDDSDSPVIPVVLGGIGGLVIIAMVAFAGYRLYHWYHTSRAEKAHRKVRVSISEDKQYTVFRGDINAIMKDEAESQTQSKTTFFFVKRDDFLEFKREEGMPVFQELAKRDKLVAHSIMLEEAAKNKYRNRFAVVSHRWKDKHHPDADGEQMSVVQQQVKKQADIEWIWIDWMCLPQSVKTSRGRVKYRKTKIQDKYFGKALHSVNMLYLFMDIYILCDLDYCNRFWCLLESFLATHLVTPQGLALAPANHYVIIPMGGFDGDQEGTTEKLMFVVDKDEEEMLAVLSSNDVFVTNQSDQTFMVGKLRKFFPECRTMCTSVANNLPNEPSTKFGQGIPMPTEVLRGTSNNTTTSVVTAVSRQSKGSNNSGSKSGSVNLTPVVPSLRFHSDTSA
jgi:sugar lactone lactonase YvrE